MTAKRIFRFCLLLLLAAVTAATARSQRRDPSASNTAAPEAVGSIQGRVLFPSGRTINSNVKIVLSNTQTPLVTLYTDKEGEFTFLDLREGTYYVQAIADGKLYEPVTQQVRVFRNNEAHVMIYLKEKTETTIKTSGSGVVSLAEYDQRIPEQAKKEYKKAVKLMNEGNALEAIKYLKQALLLYPDYLKARNDLGVQYLKLDRLTEAKEQFEAAIEKDPKYFNPRVNLGMLLVQEKNYRDAIDQLNQAIAIDSAWPASHLFLGIALLGINDLDAAEQELIKALALSGSKYSVAHYYMAHVYMRKGAREEALRELKTYLEDSPDGEQAADARLLLEKLASRR